MSLEKIARELAAPNKNQIVLIYAFNGTGKTRLSVAFKDVTKNEDNTHSGVYYNAYSEDLFVWDNDLENGEVNVKLDIQTSSLNQFHSLLSESDIREKLIGFKPNYSFKFIQHDNPEDGIKSVQFYDKTTDPDDPNNISDIPRKISRGEERIFVWCFFLALFEVEGWADKQSAHFFIDDPVSSLDDHNIFITAFTLIDLIDTHFKKRKFIITTHHFGFFSILADWLTKGEKASKYNKNKNKNKNNNDDDKVRVCTLSLKNGEISLENSKNDVFLYHLRLLQLLEQASTDGEVKAYHFVLLRQVLENVASFLGVSGFGYVLEQIGVNVNEIASIVNTLSHKKVYYFETDEVVPKNLETFETILNGLKEKYGFVFKAAAKAPTGNEALKRKVST